MWGGNLELPGHSARSSQLPASSACSLPTPGAPSWAAGARLLPRVTQRFPCYRAFAQPSAPPGTPWPIARMLRGSGTHPTGPAPCWKHKVPRSSTPPAASSRAGPRSSVGCEGCGCGMVSTAMPRGWLGRVGSFCNTGTPGAGPAWCSRRAPGSPTPPQLLSPSPPSPSQP